MFVSVCLFVCLSVREDISETHARSLPISLCMLPLAVARSSSDRVTKYQREEAIWGVCPDHSKTLTIFAAAVAAAFAAKGIIQYARQAQIGTYKILSAGDAVHRAERG